MPNRSTLRVCACEKLCLSVIGLYTDRGSPWWGKFVGIVTSNKSAATNPAKQLIGVLARGAIDLIHGFTSDRTPISMSLSH